MIKIWDLETPALIIKEQTLRQNIIAMQQLADSCGVSLRPHTKTHRTPALAHLQVEAGAKGITVAKIGEAEVMAANGLDDIFISSVIAGKSKYERLFSLAQQTNITIGVDSSVQVQGLGEVFKQSRAPLKVMIEIEVGENRTGLKFAADVLALAKEIQEYPYLNFKGLYTHEGHSYGAKDIAHCRQIMQKSQEEILDLAQLLRNNNIAVDVISIGSTPSIMHGTIISGITEIRPGTYILMDAAQGASLNDYSKCAASVLATVISKPTASRVVLDTGVKALTAFVRRGGICNTPGYGKLARYDNIYIDRIYDEHAVVESEKLCAQVAIGDKLQIIPNHICPVCNLYDKMYLYDNDIVVSELPISCRGKSQ